jgi:hypothetical protein
MPIVFSMEWNCAEPFSISAMIEFSPARSGYVTLKVYSILGEEVATLVPRNLSAGTHRVEWNASGVSSGVCLYRLLKPSGLALLCLGAGDLESDIVEDCLGARMYWSHYDVDTNLHLLSACGFELIWSQVVADATSPGSGHLFVLVQKCRY